MISFDKAKEIAAGETEKRAEKYRADGMEVRAPLLAWEAEKVWTFAAAIPQLQEEGYAPGAIMITIDKEDGHIWTELVSGDDN